MQGKWCFFTGHRMIPESKKSIIIERLKENVIRLINEGVTDYIAGGALGFDYLASTVVLCLKNQYPEIRLHLFLPCYGSEKKWTDTDKFFFHILKTKSDTVRYVTENPYTEDCMYRRNRAMADAALHCIAYCTRTKSGTGKTINYAREHGCKITNIADEI